MANPTMKSGFRTRFEIKSLGGGIGIRTEIKTAEAAVLTASAALATKTLEQTALANQISTLESENDALDTQADYYQNIIDTSEDSEAVDEATAQKAVVDDTIGANDDLIAAATTEKDAVDIEVTTLTSDLADAEATRDGLIATANVGVYEVVPLLEEGKLFPITKAEYDKFLPIDGSTNGRPITVPTETFEDGEIEFTMGINKSNGIHDRLERAAGTSDLIQARSTATDGRVYSFAFYVTEFERMAESKKANRAKVKGTIDGDVSIA